MHDEPPVLLTDAQMRRFIAEGYLILRADAPPELHATVQARMERILKQEGNPGNNILPAIPEMQRLLDSPTVRGALTSVLGANYVLHPHRFAHNNEPAERTEEGMKAGRGTHAYIGWHQDHHSPLARPRHHYPRYAMILYYPQDTPPEMGPTQLIPATHWNRRLTERDYERGFQAAGAAGTCVLVHFDIAHGGSLNRTERTRYMMKFVFARTEEPTAPSWDCRTTMWRTPDDLSVPLELPLAWAHHWNWLCGRDPNAGAPGLAPPTSDALAELLAQRNGDDPERQQTIYALAALGEAAVAPLAEALSQIEGDGWYEGAIVMEDAAYALAAVGEPAVPALLALLSHSSDWVRINALFALGEMGGRAQEAVPAILAQLRHPAHEVVRTALDALGQIGIAEEIALPEFHRLLREDNPDWQKPIFRAWTGENQARVNAMMALLRLGWKSPAALRLIAESLDDPCGYVGGFGAEALLRSETPFGIRAACAYLQAHRWDNTLQKGVRTY
jgi:hypothetical protein